MALDVLDAPPTLLGFRIPPKEQLPKAAAKSETRIPPRESPLSKVVNKVALGLALDMRALGWRGKAIEGDGQLISQVTEPAFIDDLKYLLEELAEDTTLFRQEFAPGVAENFVRTLMFAYVFNEAKRTNLAATNADLFSANIPPFLENSPAWKLAIILMTPSEKSDKRIPFKHFMTEARDLRTMVAWEKERNPRYDLGAEMTIRSGLHRALHSGEHKDDSFESPAIMIEEQRVSFQKVLATMLGILEKANVPQGAKPVTAGAS